MKNKGQKNSTPEHRSFIKGLVLLSKTNNDIIDSFIKVYGSNVLKPESIKYWIRKIKNGVSSVNDSPRSGRPSFINKDAIMSYHAEHKRDSAKTIAAKLKCSHSTVLKTLKERNIKYLRSQAIPHDLEPFQKVNRVEKCKNALWLIENDPNFYNNLITCDEKQIYFKNEARTGFWCRKGSPIPQQCTKEAFRGKVMLSIYWDCEGVLLYELSKRGESVNRFRYWEQLTVLNQILRKIRPNKGDNQQIYLLHDNARPHTANEVTNALEHWKWCVIDHPSYSPDLAPSDYFLFKDMEVALRDEIFSTRQEIDKWLIKYLTSKPKDYFRSGIYKLEHKYREIIALGGNYRPAYR
jgi:histone-lysine N-methyltransferase SETMAR